ncbi:MAG: glycosyltransferase family 4 protein [Desulfobulbaceae bacterium]|nr:MAG: glycosyltransferase family 4 protein [Desulfobulbaceae bacterium]
MRTMLIASGDLWAGAEVMVSHLCCCLARMPEVKLLVVLLNRGRLANELESLGVEVRVIDEQMLSFSALILNVRSIINVFLPDIIHSHRYKENFLAWSASLGKGTIKLVATQHGMPEQAGRGETILNRLRNVVFFRLLSCCFDRTVLVSGEMRRNMVHSYGFTEDNVTVIHNGISIPERVGSRNGERLIVGSAGRFFPVKDFSLLVDIARLVITCNDSVDFVIAGDGPLFNELKEKITRFELQDRFHLRGHQEDMAAFYQGLDVYINTSVHEGLPMSVLEALAYRLPVIAPKVGGFPEVIEEGKNGFLVHGRDPQMFADRIFELLNPDVRESMSVAARERALQCFSREAMARQYHLLYEELCGD